MLDAIYSFFNLRWRPQRHFRPLPDYIKRILVPSPGGDLELLVSSPTNPDPEIAPIFFIHGGYGSAGVWLDWLRYLHEAGYRGHVYAYSARNHGASYSVPYFRMVYRTGFEEIVGDCMTCLAFALKQQKASGHSEEVILVGHSSGGGLAQYALSKGLAQCRALCLVDAIPHFGAIPVYANWMKHDPWAYPRNLFHLQHPTSPLSSQRLVHGAFFGDRFPMYRTKEFMGWMPPYETLLWPLKMMGDFTSWWRGSSKWLNVKHILNSISGNRESPTKDRVCVMVGDQDVLMDLDMCRRQAAEYRQALTEMRSKQTEIDREDTRTVSAQDGVMVESGQGVSLVVVHGAGHHVQNDVQQKEAAEALLQFVRQC